MHDAENVTGQMLVLSMTLHCDLDTTSNEMDIMLCLVVRMSRHDNHLVYSRCMYGLLPCLLAAM